MGPSSDLLNEKCRSGALGLPVFIGPLGDSDTCSNLRTTDLDKLREGMFQTEGEDSGQQALPPPPPSPLMQEGGEGWE